MLTMKQPQEIESMYVLPSIRKELAKSLISSCHLNQQETSILLGVTKSAVTQYIKSKRASKIRLGNEILAEIKKSAKKISKGRECVTEEMQRICSILKKKSILCKIHRRYEPVAKSCKVCLR